MIAVVTGASSGIGAEFCRALDAEGLDSIWLVARRADRLESLASELSTPCVVIPADLTDRGQLSDFVDRIGSSGERVGYLVNCAGVGRFGETWDLSSDETLSMIDLNVSALTEMCRGCIPCMGSGSHIINVCSASAYLPLEGLNVYSATKAYVSAFTLGLSEELKKKGVTVTAVCPGPMETEFLDVGRISGNSRTFAMLPYCDQVRVAGGTLRAAKAGRTIYTPRLFYKTYRLLAKVTPAKLMMKLTKT